MSKASVEIDVQTGAMMVALGQGIAGAFTPSDALADKLKTASSHVGALDSYLYLFSVTASHGSCCMLPSLPSDALAHKLKTASSHVGVHPGHLSPSYVFVSRQRSCRCRRGCSAAGGS